LRYVSTRRRAAILDFDDVLIAGLASGGRIYAPEEQRFGLGTPSASSSLAHQIALLCLALRFGDM